MSSNPVDPVKFADPYSLTITSPNFISVEKPVYTLLQTKFQHIISQIKLECYPTSLVFPSEIASNLIIPKLQQSFVPFPAMNMAL